MDEKMIAANLAVVEAHFGSEAAGRIEAALELYTDDIVWEAPSRNLVIKDEGPRMISNIVECAHEDLQVDMPVVAVYDDVTPEWTLVKFKPA